MVLPTYPQESTNCFHEVVLIKSVKIAPDTNLVVGAKQDSIIRVVQNILIYYETLEEKTC